MTVGNTCEALLSATLLRRFGWHGGRSTSVREMLALLTIPPFATAPLSATVGTLTLLAIGEVTRSSVPDAWWTWWVGNALGVVAFTPFLTAWLTPPLPRIARERQTEALGLVITASLGAMHALFGIFPRAATTFCAASACTTLAGPAAGASRGGRSSFAR